MSGPTLPTVEAHEFHSIATVFPLMEGQEFVRLVEDIRQNGLRDSIWLHPNGQIVDGRNRYRACAEAGVEPRFRVWDAPKHGDLLSFVVSLNLRRRHLDESQRAMVAAKIAKLADGQRKLGQLADVPSQPEAAAMLNVGERTVRRARRVLEEAPVLVEAVEQGVVAVSDAARIVRTPEETQRRAVAAVKSGEAKTAHEAVKREIKAEAVRAIGAEPSMDGGPYHVLVVDPPWRYEKRADDATNRAALPYPDMSLTEICALPVPSLACPDAIVWLWTTNAFMRQAYEVADAWGFQVMTILTWVKDKMGVGDWLRGQTEHALMLVRGRPVVTLGSQTTALVAPRREHSRKPDAFYALVESLCPGSKLELFARETRNGWNSWGAERTKFDAKAS